MSARTLPAHPDLRHLKSEAKQLHKELAAGEPGAAVRARTNLRRLSDGDAVADVWRPLPAEVTRSSPDCCETRPCGPFTEARIVWFLPTTPGP